MPDALERLEEVQLPRLWWLDHSFRGGVAKRVGWWLVLEKCRFHQYVVVFRDGTRGPVSWGTNPVEDLEEN
jgi:hypothetical protein